MEGTTEATDVTCIKKNILNPSYFRPCPHHEVYSFENEGFTLTDASNVFNSHNFGGISKNATITGHFRFAFEENTAREIDGFQKFFRPTEQKRKAGVLKFLLRMKSSVFVTD